MFLKVLLLLSDQNRNMMRGCSSVVERHLPMVNVVGSSPISRLILLKQLFS